MAMETTLATRSAAQLAALYRDRACSPVDVVDAVLDRIKRTNPSCNAVVTVAAEQARADAVRLEADWGRGADSLPALFGIPVTVKDLTATKGIRTTRGSLVHRQWVPDFDAVAVERLRAAGAIIVGKTNTSEEGWQADSGNRVFGPTANPWRSDRTAGGSSGGAAAAVALGCGPIGTGTDGAGSIRIPASFCGVVGLKPSFGLVPYHPSSAELLSHFGPLTRTVADAATALDVLAGRDDRDAHSWGRPPFGFAARTEVAPANLRIALIRRIGERPVHPEIAEALETFAGRLADLGHAVREGPKLDDPYDVLEVILAAHAAADHRSDPAEVLDLLDPGLRAVVERGATLTATSLAAAQIERTAFREHARQALAGFDVAVMPTVATLPLRLGADRPPGEDHTARARLAWASFVYPWNLAGFPAISIPGGFSGGGLPIGVQIVGPGRADALILRLARQVESAHGWLDSYQNLADKDAGR